MIEEERCPSMVGQQKAPKLALRGYDDRKVMRSVMRVDRGPIRCRDQGTLRRRSI